MAMQYDQGASHTVDDMTSNERGLVDPEFGLGINPSHRAMLRFDTEVQDLRILGVRVRPLFIGKARHFAKIEKTAAGIDVTLPRGMKAKPTSATRHGYWMRPDLFTIPVNLYEKRLFGRRAVSLQ